jgi:hypothetical protein
MINIDWNRLNDVDFQRFCNVLLHFEVSKKVSPFSAPGKDGGIDASYEGDYLDKSGKWRFQAKLHKTDRKTAYNSIKTDIKEDIRNNVKDENNLVFLTNVNILPQEKDELFEIANKELEEIGKKDLFFDIWYEEKIISLVSHYPIIEIWLNKDFTAQLQPYEDFYKDALSANISDSYVLNNPFYARQDKLLELRNAFADKKIKNILVTGRPGMGKTRLCIEFFKQIIDKEYENWIVLVLSNRGSIEFDTLNRAFISDKNFLVFIDDIQEIQPDILSDIFELVNTKRTNEVKLILTSRNSEVYNSVKIVFNQRNEINTSNIIVENLQPDETENLFKNEVKDSVYNRYITTLTQISKGYLLMIVAILRAIVQGKRIEDIKKEDLLQDNINHYLNKIVDKLHNTDGLDKKNIRNIINIFSLIEPFRFDDNFINHISEKEEISDVDIETIFNYLKEIKFITGRYNFSIKPDYYSDIILGKALENNRWIKKKLNIYINYIDNIIVNLSSVEETSDIEEGGILNEILEEYIEIIKSINTTGGLTRIFDTLSYVTFKKPEIGIKAIKILTDYFKNKNNLIAKEIREESETKSYNYHMSTLLSTIGRVFREISFHENRYDDLFTITKELYNTTKYKELINYSFGFNYHDFPNYNCSKQFFLSTKILELSKNAEIEDSIIDFLTICANQILPLSYTDTGSKPYQNYAIKLTTFYLKELPQIKKFRINIIHGLFHLYKNAIQELQKDKILKILIDIPREIFSTTHHTGKPYIGLQEKKLVLDYIFEITKHNIPVKYIDWILEKLHWYIQWGIEEQFKETIEQIKNNLSPKKLSEELINLFKKEENYLVSDRKDYENELDKNCRQLIEKNTAEEIGVALIEIYENYEYPPYEYLGRFQRILETDFIEKTKKFLSYLWNKTPKYLIKYHSSSFQRLYFTQGENEFFRGFVYNIYNIKSNEAFGCILNIYNWLDIKKHVPILKKEDFEIILKIYEADKTELYYNYASSIPYLLFYDIEIGKKNLKDFLNKCSDDNADHLFLAFNQGLKDIFFEIYSELLLKHTIKFTLSYNLETALYNVFANSVKNKGFESICEYFEKRILFKISKLESQESSVHYDIAPRFGGHRFTKEMELKDKMAFFDYFIDWYVNSELKGYFDFFYKPILEYFSPSPQVTEDLKGLYHRKLTLWITDFDKTLKFASILDIHPSKNDNLFDILNEIANNASQYSEEQKRKILSECFTAIVQTGVKHGKAGEPFPVDIEIRDLLINYTSKHKLSSESKNLFENAIKSLNNDIERFDDDGEDLW